MLWQVLMLHQRSYPRSSQVRSMQEYPVILLHLYWGIRRWVEQRLSTERSQRYWWLIGAMSSWSYRHWRCVPFRDRWQHRALGEWVWLSRLWRVQQCFCCGLVMSQKHWRLRLHRYRVMVSWYLHRERYARPSHMRGRDERHVRWVRFVWVCRLFWQPRYLSRDWQMLIPYQRVMQRWGVTIVIVRERRWYWYQKSTPMQQWSRLPRR